MLPLLERHPALTPTTLLEHLQEQKPDQDWSSLKRTLQRRLRGYRLQRIEREMEEMLEAEPRAQAEAEPEEAAVLPDVNEYE